MTPRGVWAINGHSPQLGIDAEPASGNEAGPHFIGIQVMILALFFVVFFLAATAIAKLVASFANKTGSLANLRLNSGEACVEAMGCKALDRGPLLATNTSAFSDNPSFHRWNWLAVKSSGLVTVVAKTPRRTEPQFRWRVVQQRCDADAEGLILTCATARH